MYCLIDDIKQVVPEYELIQLSNDDGSATEVDEDVINSAIKYAEATINGYLRSRYSLPLVAASVPELIKNYCIDLAVCRLHSRRFTQDMPESILNKEKFIVRELEKIQKGTISLNVEVGNDEINSVPDSPDYLVNKTSDDQVFSDDVLSRF